MSSEETTESSRLPRNLLSALDECLALVDDIVNKQQSMLATSRKNHELQSEFAAELKINKELKEKLEEVNKSSSALDKMCGKFESINIRENDQARLNNAQEMLRIAKEYTGIHWDYTAPLNIAKGYVKNNSKMLLECFELKMDGKDNSSAVSNLWKYVDSAATNDWQDLVTSRVIDKENLRNN